MIDKVPKKHRENAPLAELVRHWDRAAFEVLCRRLEVLLVRGYVKNAVEALRSFNGMITYEPPTVDSHVSEVFPVRTANALEEYGFLTVGAACKAKDSDLLKIANFGAGTLRQVDCIRTALKNKTPLPRVLDETFPDLKPEFEIDWDYLAMVVRKENEMSVGTQTSQTKLDVLLGIISKSDQAIAEIDAEIQKHESRIAELKRVRDILSPRKASPSRSYQKGSTDRFRIAEEKIVAAIEQNGPQKARDLEEVAGESFTTIGRIVARSEKLVKVGGAISLKQ